MLRNYINSVFDKYDTDRNGTLDSQEMTRFFNDLFKKLNINMVVTEAQAL
jgi:Ca2+-binding EF-hand superfamily protein